MTDGFVAERVIGEWMTVYDTERPHSALGGATPAEAYASERPGDMMDKARALPTSPHAHQKQEAFKMNRGDHQPEYTLTSLPNCPNNRDQLRDCF